MDIGVDARIRRSTTKSLFLLSMLSIPSVAYCQGDEIRARAGQLAVVERTGSELLYQRSPNWGAIGRSFDVAVGPAETATWGVQVWRVSVGDHFYLLVEDDGHLYRAGGFHEADLREVATSLWTTAPCNESIERLADCLAIVADPYGAAAVLGTSFSAEERSAHAFSILASEKPRGWPEDAILQRSDGKKGVVTTVITQNRGNLPQSWHAIAYSFVFEGQQLVAWSQRQHDLVDTGDL